LTFLNNMSQHVKAVRNHDGNDNSVVKEEDQSYIAQKTEMSQLNVTALSQSTIIATSNKRNLGVTEPSPRRTLTLREKIEKLLDSNQSTIFMSVITVYVLFADDIRNLATTKDADDVWFAFACICLALFSLELVISCIVKKDYLWSFYFWLDLIATLSMIPDIGWIWYPMIGIEEDGDSGGNASQIQKAGRASKAGTRTSRVIRIIRLIRLIRIVKLYKNAQTAMKNRAQDDDDIEEFQAQMPIESRVGKKLSDLTIKRVIILVLILLLILPLFDTDFYITDPYSWDFGLDELMELRGNAGFDVVRQQYIAYHEDDAYPLIYISYEDMKSETYEWDTDTKTEDLRFAEKYYASSDYEAVAVFDIRYENRVTSGLNICRTVFVCIVLTLGAIYFTKDANDLVITPIEKMMDKVNKIARNPMMASEVRKNDIFELINNNEQGCWAKICKSKENTNEYETTILEDTIIKIGVLLALGFGEAGSSIIATNMERAGDLDPTLSGTRCMAVFGFCDIRNFTDSTEILLEGVMLFVNEIAQIVHGVVDHFQGAANKNIGDAFLLVWKLNKDDVEEGEEGLQVRNDSKRGMYIADCALTAFLKIIAKINRDPVILKYKTHEQLNKRMPNYAVKMGFGLHIGWAIEGAIGSEYKIDASYLSPHVNMASRLEAATKQYGVPFLLSGSIYDMLSTQAKMLCRHIDTVTVKGSEKPMRLYTSDVDPKDLTPTLASKERMSTRLKRKKLRQALEKGMLNSYSILENSKELRSMRSHITEEFISTFDKGMQAYIAGDWGDAKDWIEKALELKPQDGPSETLINVMSEEDFKAPSDWSGYRVLTEK
jgi:class 3 adenylate cyclase